ncbi:hypothetical protein L226DRAFT_541411 [Lentinus tigrinus ALCF2SS1-7]|uniref:uncharacterized protein n=1 Tax=Lentinus tigrinus ALCF2SS1-7 TaxID=1328758 RepID=UPI0011662A2D|nr:hypothetical protein L226DRAFT_541411 [Lentinus tigrinus ALCF2SS1-7]
MWPTSFNVIYLSNVQVPGRTFLHHLLHSSTYLDPSRAQNLPSTCSVHDIESAIQASIRKALRGPVLLRDFALKADGGKILPALTTTVPVDKSAPNLQTFGPEVVIDDHTAIGRCWSTVVPSQVGLSTPTLIYPTNVTIDHIPRELAADIRRAPRHVTLWGVVDGKSNRARYKALIAARGGRMPTAPSLTSGHVFLDLASLEYDINAESHIQTFRVFRDVVESGMDFGVFVVEILDDWGADDVCLYRVRIHGVSAGLGSK